MAATVNEGIPARFTRGESVRWYENRRDYLPVDGWELTVALVLANQVQKITATDNGDGRHLVTILPAASLEFQPGLYRYQVKVSDGTDAHVLEQGTVEVLQSFADVSSGWDARTHNERVLESINALLEGKATADQQSISVEGQSLSRYSWAELLEMQRTYEWRVRKDRDQERIDAGLPSDRFRQVRFTR